jgi:D-lactate dehydrogenase
LSALRAGGTRLIALRSAGFNNVDVAAAAEQNLTVLRVPAYSPQAVAEHAVALMLTLNRHLHRAYDRVRDGNFDLNGLVGFDMAGKIVGIVGTGKIGAALARILTGFNCRLLGYDAFRNPACLELGVQYSLIRSCSCLLLIAAICNSWAKASVREASSMMVVECLRTATSSDPT